jgi:hypothetical protein
VRAVPLQPGSPVAKELRGQPRSPFTTNWQQQQPEQDSRDAPAAAAADIIGFEQRKVSRHYLCWILVQAEQERIAWHPCIFSPLD